MVLDPKWTDNVTGPFHDQTTHGITALTMRQFASDVGSQVVSPGMVFIGPYDNAHTYHPNDVVSSAGSSYVLGGIVNQTGVAPPGGAWLVLAAKGDPGAGVAFGTTAGTACEGNDSRLSDQRVPTNASVTDAKISGTLSPSKITGTAVVTADSRLSDTRTPTDGSVTTAKLAALAVTAAKIANGTITSTQIATGGVGLGNLVNIAAGTVLGNGSFTGQPPQAVDMSTLADMLALILGADQVGVSTIGGVVGPSVQTALQDLVGQVAAVADPLFE